MCASCYSRDGKGSSTAVSNLWNSHEGCASREPPVRLLFERGPEVVQVKATIPERGLHSHEWEFLIWWSSDDQSEITKLPDFFGDLWLGQAERARKAQDGKISWMSEASDSGQNSEPIVGSRKQFAGPVPD